MAERRSPKPKVGGSIPSWPASMLVGKRTNKISMADKIKLVLAVVLLGLGIGAFYYYAQYSAPVRVLGLLVLVAVAVGVALQTQVGRQAWAFVLEARNEIRKVVWPTRKETTQTTLVVMIVVLLVAIILWLLDMFLLWAVQLLTNQGA